MYYDENGEGKFDKDLAGSMLFELKVSISKDWKKIKMGA